VGEDEILDVRQWPELPPTLKLIAYFDTCQAVG